MRACALVPAYQAELSVGRVIADLRACWPTEDAVFVIDDGSLDRTAEVAREAGARVITHERNRGKGAALRTGMAAAIAAGFDAAVTVDADGQHPAEEALRLLDPSVPHALILGLRDLAGANAPRANRISNGISNFFLSLFAGRALADTQCGLRRYPLPRALELGATDDGYAFEAEIILRAVAAGLSIVEMPIRVIYPEESHRVTHFDSVRDPMRIIARVLATLAATRGMQRPAPSQREIATARREVAPARIEPDARPESGAEAPRISA